MKHNWQYKKLGEVCDVIGGSTPRTDIPEYWNGVYNWFTPAEIDDSKYFSESERKITESAVKSTGLTLLPVGTVLLTSRAPIGKLGILRKEAYCNQGFKNLVCKDGLFNEYLFYTLQYLKEDIQDKGRGATFKEISKKTTESIEIPVPPMEVQERIVAELDELNAVIEAKREQLKQLDLLAQSIFYTTFGDPISNPKSWPTQNFENTIEKIKYPNKLKTSDYNKEGKYPIISQEENLVSGYTDHADCVFQISNPVIIFGDHTRCLKYIDFSFALGADGVKILAPSTINPRFFYYTLLLFKIPSLGYSRHYRLLKELAIPVPPLALQEEFAVKVEAIEAQKARVEASIKELRTLLDSRMDYWFN